MKNKHVMCAVWFEVYQPLSCLLIWFLPVELTFGGLLAADLYRIKKATGGAFQKTEPKSKQNQMLK